MATYKRTGVARNPAWGAGGAAPGAGPSSGPGSMPNAGGASPTGWVNVQDYLRANQGQADAMGQRVAGELEQEATSAQPAADKYRADMNTFANAPTTATNPAYKTWFDQFNTLQSGHAAKNPGVIDNFMTHMPEKTIAAPTATQPGMPSAPGAALDKIKSAATPGGLATYFADKAGPSYNAGQSNLDSYLAGAGGGGQAIQGVAQKYGNVLDLVRFPYPGASGGNRPKGPDDRFDGPGSTPTAEAPKAGPDTILAGAGTIQPRPGDAPWQPSNGKRKRVV